jgi:hypothetical protein
MVFIFIYMVEKMGVFKSVMAKSLIAGIAFALSACTGLLPRAKQETQTPWHSYAEAQAMFEKIIPGKTRLVDLKALAVEPDQTPNVALLSHTDLLRRLFPATSFDLRLLDPGLQECMSPPHTCFAYEIEQVSLDRQRFGSFWLDFFNFKRQVNVSGWRFNAVIVIKHDTVVYKLWSGKPNVHQLELESSPLGPFQGFGPALLTR